MQHALTAQTIQTHQPNTRQATKRTYSAPIRMRPRSVFLIFAVYSRDMQMKLRVTASNVRVNTPDPMENKAQISPSTDSHTKFTATIVADKTKLTTTTEMLMLASSPTSVCCMPAVVDVSRRVINIASNAFKILCCTISEFANGGKTFVEKVEDHLARIGVDDALVLNPEGTLQHYLLHVLADDVETVLAVVAAAYLRKKLAHVPK